MNYMTIKEAAQLWGISERRVQTLCRADRIEGAKKFGRDWAIPINTEKPKDNRVKTGRYIEWRKNKEIKYGKVD